MEAFRRADVLAAATASIKPDRVFAGRWLILMAPVRRKCHRAIILPGGRPIIAGCVALPPYGATAFAYLLRFYS
jgi:hypothetical protein